MKIMQGRAEFKPITILIQTENEAKAMHRIMEDVVNHFGTLPDELNLAKGICDWFMEKEE